MYEKTRIQTHIEMYGKNAYKCMKKTRVQTRIQMYEKNIQLYDKISHTKSHTNV